MTVELSPRLHSLIRSKVKTGKYTSPTDVVSEALHLLEMRDQQEQLRKRDLAGKIDQAWESLERGEGVEGLDFFKALEKEERVLSRRKRA